MTKNGNKKTTQSTNDTALEQNCVYRNYFMLEAVFVMMILKIKQYKKYTFGEKTYGIFQDYGSLPRID